MTKKLLVPYSTEKASSVGKSFVAPVHTGDRGLFVSLASLKSIDFAAVVYVGRDVTPEDLFAKIVNAGLKILPTVDVQMGMIKEYFDHLSQLKVGDVVRVGFDSGDRIELIKQSKPNSSRKTSKLP